jgi:hypothetical protein
MAKNVLFVVRAVAADEALRAKLDDWYATDHLPTALSAFRAQKAWRAWSATDPSVHYAYYQFADRAQLDERLNSPDFRALVADFDRAFPAGVTRSREILNLAEELP